VTVQRSSAGKGETGWHPTLHPPVLPEMAHTTSPIAKTRNAIATNLRGVMLGFRFIAGPTLRAVPPQLGLSAN